MSDSNASKVIVETANDLEYVKGLLQHHLGSKIDQSLVDQLKLTIEQNVIVDQATEQQHLALKQQEDERIAAELEQVKVEGARREVEILEKINQKIAELVNICQQKGGCSSSNDVLHLDEQCIKSLMQLTDKSSGQPSLIGKDSIVQLNDLMRLCQ